MKKTTILLIGLVVALALVAIPLLSAMAQDTMPEPLDPQSWKFPKDMTWDDWQDNAAFNWKIDGDKITPTSVRRGLLVLCDFVDRPFIVTSSKGTEQMGNPLIGGVKQDELVTFWEGFLNDPNFEWDGETNHGVTISEFWRENSQGRWKIELDGAGVYRLPGYEFEYGLDTSMNHTNDLPAGFTRRSGLNSLAVNAAIADGVDLNKYDFAFVLHSGSAESQVWEEAGYMMFYDETTVGYEYSAKFRVDQMRAKGITIPAATDAWLAARPAPVKGENGRGWWARTRYVPWTSWWAATAVWSSASSISVGGRTFRLSQQGETNGNATFSHEFSHIVGVADNYGTNTSERTYSGFWDSMAGGSMTGFGGNHTRYMVPNLQGGAVPTHMMTRVKRKLGFLDDNNLTNVTHTSLRNGTPVVTEIYARTTPVGNQFAALYPELAAINDKVRAGKAGLALRIYGFTDQRPRILTSADWESETNAGANRYDNYNVEVIQQTGYDSAQADHGVIITKNRETLSESAPYTWVMNSHPGGLDVVDFYTPVGPNGEPSVPQGLRNNCNNQLNAALFHAGKSFVDTGYYANTYSRKTGNGPDDWIINKPGSLVYGEERDGRDIIAGNTVNEYIDTYNRLHFYILDKFSSPGPYGDEILSYQVGVRHFDGVAVGGALEVAVADVDAERAGRVAVASFDITNTGNATDIIRVGVDGLDVTLLNDLYAVGAGQTITVPFYVEITDEVIALANEGQEVVLTASSETNSTKVGAAAMAVSDLLYIYNFYVYLDAQMIDHETIEVDVMLEGDLNYTQAIASVAYDSSLLEFAGYANLSGLAAEVKKNGADKINLRSVPSLNMLVGAPCATPLRLVTLIFTVNNNFAGESIDTALNFAAVEVTPKAGLAATTAPGKPLPLTLFKIEDENL